MVRYIFEFNSEGQMLAFQTRLTIAGSPKFDGGTTDDDIVYSYIQ